jgi:hypothetical protein
MNKFNMRKSQSEGKFNTAIEVRRLKPINALEKIVMHREARQR